MDAISSRIIALRDALNLNQGQFAARLGVTGSAISQYEKGKRRPNSYFYSTVVKEFNVNVKWLTSGEGSMFIEVPDQPIYKSADIISLPIAGRISAGPPLEVIDLPPVEHVVVGGLLDYPSSYYMAFRVDGDSMYPDIKHGDIVIVCSQYDFAKLNKKVCAVMLDGEVTLKTVFIDNRHRQTMLVPVNHKKHSPIVLNEDDNCDAKIIGVMVLLIRKSYEEEIS